MKLKLLVLATLLSLSTVAHATPPKEVGLPNLSLTADVNLGQHQKQYSNSDSSATGLGLGKASAGAGAEASSTSGGNTLAGGDTVSNTTSNVSNRFLNLPSHVVPVPPSVLAGAGVVQTVGACGVLQDVRREKVEGTFHGLLYDTKVNLGYREKLVPYYDHEDKQVLFKEVVQGNLTYLIGSQPIILSSVIGTGGARQFGLGGNSSSGNNGSGSLGSSGSNQQQVEHIQLIDCIYQIIDNTPRSSTVNVPPVVTKKNNQ